MKSSFVNMCHASVENKGTSVIGGKDGNKLIVLGVGIMVGMIGPGLECTTGWEIRWFKIMVCPSKL
jgi:hypothetical protein